MNITSLVNSFVIEAAVPVSCVKWTLHALIMQERPSHHFVQRRL